MWKQKWFGLDNEAYDNFYLVRKFKKSAIKKKKKKKKEFTDKKIKRNAISYDTIRVFVQNVRSLSKHADVYVYMYI